MRPFVLIGFLFSLVLYGQNGILKFDFGTMGKMSLDIDDQDYLIGLIKDDQNNTYFYGNTTVYQGGNYPLDIFFGKMDEQGSLDVSFGNNGIVRFDFPGYEKSTINKAVIHNNGLFFIGQGANNTSSDTLALIVGKIELNGTIDSTFATNGFFSSEFLGTYNTAGSIIIDHNDQLVFCGSTTDDQGFLVEFPLLGRLHLNGIPDSTLGNTGLIVYDYYQDSVIDAMNIPTYHFRHGDGAYLTEIVAYNNAYFVTGVFKGTAYSQLHVMSINQEGQINPNFISSGPFIFQIDPGANHFLHDIAFDGKTFYLGFETQGMYNGFHLVQLVDTSGIIGPLIQTSDLQFDMRTKFIEFWNGRLFVGGYHLDYNNSVPGYHSDNTKIYCFDQQLNEINNFNFSEKIPTGDEQGAEDLIFHQNFGIVGGYMNNIIGNNVTDLYFMAFEVNDNLSVEVGESCETKLYPNPTQDFINSDQKIGTYQIHSSTGEVVRSGFGNHQVDISNFASGVYFLQSENYSKPLKFIVE